MKTSEYANMVSSSKIIIHNAATMYHTSRSYKIKERPTLSIVLFANFDSPLASTPKGTKARPKARPKSSFMLPRVETIAPT